MKPLTKQRKYKKKTKHQVLRDKFYCQDRLILRKTKLIIGTILILSIVVVTIMLIC